MKYKRCNNEDEIRWKTKDKERCQTVETSNEAERLARTRCRE